MGRQAPKYSQKQLTDFLRKVALESDTVDNDGELISNAEKLARVVWQKALGYVETTFRNGETIDKTHPPAAWAIQLLLERLEGKVATAAEDSVDRVTAAERVGELCVNTLNNLAEKAVFIPSGPPPLRPKRGDPSDG